MIERRRSLRNDSAYMLAVLYTSGFLGMCFLIVLKDVPAESRTIVQQLISIMSMIQAAIAGYFYGASKASAESGKATTAAVAAATSASVQTGAPIVAETVAIDANTATVNTERKP